MLFRSLRSPFDPASQMQAAMEFQKKGKVEKPTINTRYILFIVSGAFTNLVDLVKKRAHKTTLGFGGNVERDDDAEYLAQAISEDFVKFGFEPEFVGRLPVHVFCHQLSVEHLFEILQHSEGSIIRQYERAFRAYGIEVIFEQEGLKAIAELAHEEKTGARGLMTVCERLFRNFKYELPATDVTMFVVNRELADHPADVLERLLADPGFRQRSVGRYILSRYAAQFLEQTEIELEFAEDAIDALCDKAVGTGDELFGVGIRAGQVALDGAHPPVIGLVFGQVAVDGSPGGLSRIGIARSFGQAGDRGGDVAELFLGRHLDGVGEGRSIDKGCGVGEDEGGTQVIFSLAR